MFAIAAIIAFVLSLVFEVADFAKGHLDWQTMAILGLVFVAIHLTGWLPYRRGTTPAA